jgi:hypothetical protein
MWEEYIVNLMLSQVIQLPKLFKVLSLAHLSAFNHHGSFNWLDGTHHFKQKPKYRQLFCHGIFSIHNTFHILGNGTTMELKITHPLTFMPDETTVQQPAYESTEIMYFECKIFASDRFVPS